MSQVTNHNEERQEDRSSVHTKLPENNYKKEKKNFSGLDYVYVLLCRCLEWLHKKISQNPQVST